MAECLASTCKALDSLWHQGGVEEMFVHGFKHHTFATQWTLRDPRRVESKESRTGESTGETCGLGFPCTVLENQEGPGAVTVSFLRYRLVLEVVLPRQWYRCQVEAKSNVV